MRLLHDTSWVCMIFLAAAGTGTTIAQETHDVAGPRDKPGEIGFCGTLDEQPARVVDRPAGAPEGPFNIVIDYTGSGFTAAQQTVFNAAITMWEAVISANGGSGTFTITPRFISTIAGLGLADQFSQDQFGIPVSGRVSINSTSAWFVDPTPFGNGEYTPDPNNRFQFLNGQLNAANFDMLTVINQEIAHVLGWTIGYSFFDNLVTEGPGTLRTFDAGGFDVTLGPSSQGTHADPATHPGDLMVPTIGVGTRRLISFYATMTPQQRAYNYTMPMTFVRWDYTGTESGTAYQPFDTYAEGINGATPGDILIIKAGNYPFSEPVVAGDALILWPVLGTVTIGE